jgi:hypothetical protein
LSDASGEPVEIRADLQTRGGEKRIVH